MWNTQGQAGFAARVAVLAGLACAACTPQHLAAERGPAAMADQFATIVAIRPGIGRPGIGRPGIGPNSRAAVLAVLGASAGDAGVASEFILRDDAGRTVSVVQANPDQLRLGERVLLAFAGRTRLLRPRPAA